jgi:hypothetical protein
LEQASKELNRGFNAKLDLDKFQEESRLALPSTAFSAGTAPQMRVGQVVLDSIKGSQGATQTAGQAPAAEASASAPGERKEELKVTPRKLVDITSTRNQQKKQLRTALDRFQKKFMALVHDGRQQMAGIDKAVADAGLKRDSYTDFETTLKERLLVAESWLGGTVSHDDAKKIHELTYLDLKSGDENAAAALLKEHEKLWAYNLSQLTYLPMESRDLLCCTKLEAVVDGVGAATCVEQVEEAAKLWADNLNLLQQLQKSVAVSISDLKKAIASDEKAALKAQSDAKKKAEETRQKLLEDQEMAERRRIATLKKSGAFKIKWGDIGHPKIQVYDSEGALQDALQGGPAEVVRGPFLLKTAAKFAEILKHKADDKSPEAVLKGTMERWEKSFPASSEAKKEDKVVAPLLAIMGLDLALEGFRSLKIQRVESGLPSFNSMSEHVQLYGALKDSVHFGYEPTFLATLRAQVSGVCEVLIMTPVDVTKHTKEVVVDASEVTFQKAEDVLKHMTENEATVCKTKGVSVWHGTVEPGMLLYVPIGCAIATSVASASNLSALKYPFLPSSDKEAARQALAELQKWKPSAAEAKLLGVFQDVLVVGT